MLISLVLGLVMGAVSVIFALQNNFPVTVTFLGSDFTSSLAVITVLSILAGIIITLLFSLPGAIRNSFLISRLKKENKKMFDELEASRALKHDHIASQVDSISESKVI
jgi:uncharacterized integral membrane protein